MNTFWFLWEDSVPISIPKSAELNNRNVGLYGKSRLEWKGNNQESQLWHTIGIGHDLVNVVAQADCVHQQDVKCVDWKSFNGANHVTGKIDPSWQYIPVFSSARGRCWRPFGYRIDAYEKVTTERMILYLP